jgi:Protein of unknown function (DUF2585)
MSASKSAPWLVLAAVLVLHVVALRAEGRRWWCACESPTLWTGDARGPHNSQHLLDPYSLSHVSHGILLWGLLWLVARRLAPAWRVGLAVALEVGWEVAENSDAVIDRFRAGTAAVGYRGDSVSNSVGDVLCCAAGVVLARRLGLWWSVALVAAIEGALLVWIRDNIVLDALMLVWPSAAIKAWQG